MECCQKKKLRAGNSFIRMTNARFAPIVGAREEVDAFPRFGGDAGCFDGSSKVWWSYIMIVSFHYKTNPFSYYIVLKIYWSINLSMSCVICLKLVYLVYQIKKASLRFLNLFIIYRIFNYWTVRKLKTTEIGNISPKFGNQIHYCTSDYRFSVKYCSFWQLVFKSKLYWFFNYLIQ